MIASGERADLLVARRPLGANTGDEARSEIPEQRVEGHLGEMLGQRSIDHPAERSQGRPVATMHGELGAACAGGVQLDGSGYTGEE